MNNLNNLSVEELIERKNADFNPELKKTYIILAAGHGKRIKSNTSKMLHKVWGKSTVSRVIDSCIADEQANIIVVVGIKSKEVIENLSVYPNLIFAYQKEQKGTGHAVQIALEEAKIKNYNGTVYILLGDMGLIDYNTINSFENTYKNSNNDMMILTATFNGDVKNNHYGRIVRAKNEVKNVVGIVEYKDIMKIEKDKTLNLSYNQNEFSYSQNELIENREYNSGIYAIKSELMEKYIFEIKNNNAQGEIYLTDLVAIFNKNGLKVDAISAEKEEALMGFNTKSELLEMNNIASYKIYSRIKDIIEIEDANDFFISESIIKDFEKRDFNGEILDIKIGKGAVIDGNVSISNNVKIGRNVKINGDEIKIGENTHINRNSIIEGVVSIGENNKIKSNVIIIGTKEKPFISGNNVLIEGVSKLKSCIIADNSIIENSLLENVTIKDEQNGKAVVKNLIGNKEGLEYLK